MESGKTSERSHVDSRTHIIHEGHESHEENHVFLIHGGHERHEENHVFSSTKDTKRHEEKILRKMVMSRLSLLRELCV
jgi:hypothetical protein